MLFRLLGLIRRVTLDTASGLVRQLRCLLICGTERNGTPDSAKCLFFGTNQNEPKQLPSLVVIVLNKIEQTFTPEKQRLYRYYTERN